MKDVDVPADEGFVLHNRLQERNVGTDTSNPNSASARRARATACSKVLPWQMSLTSKESK